MSRQVHEKRLRVIRVHRYLHPYHGRLPFGLTHAVASVIHCAMGVDIKAFANRLMEYLGIPWEKALQYANAIGDTPQVDADGLVVIRDEKNVIIDRISIPLD